MGLVGGDQRGWRPRALGETIGDDERAEGRWGTSGCSLLSFSIEKLGTLVGLLLIMQDDYKVRCLGKDVERHY